MRQLKILALGLAVSGTVAAAAAAQSSDGMGGSSGSPAPGMMQQGMMQDCVMQGGQARGRMMDGMKQMHGKMVQMHGPDGMSAMRDRHMMGMGKPGMMAEQLATALQEYDADGSGSLSLAEFETFHSALIREQMVDRFQHLDADGDGAVTEAEISAQTSRMQEMMQRRGMMQGGSSGMAQEEDVQEETEGN
ncbi:calcium-binding protein [Cribrihabitans neustonicus]|uniref:calcium-binding protein n=1 Tax=Cribrihabitans neustonicus TaxID=1429085 RepID=UPI003B59D4FD